MVVVFVGIDADLDFWVHLAKFDERAHETGLDERVLLYPVSTCTQYHEYS